MSESELCEIGLPAILATRRVNGLQLRALSSRKLIRDFSLSLSSKLKERELLLLQPPIYRDPNPDPDRGAELKAIRLPR